jgi:uncharacterized membrane protein YfcA
MFLTIIGGISGFVSGLLGIGGGLVIVPALIFALPHLGISGPDIPKIAMATSLALIIPTSIASAQAHAARGAVDWRMLGMLAPSIVVGAFLSAILAPTFNTHLVVLLFVAFAVVTSWRLLARGEKETHDPAAVKPPSAATTSLKGATGGGMAAALGIGGAFFIIPILERFMSVQRAVGTASALGIPLSIAGSVGYILAEVPSGCRQGCVGYVFFPAVAAVGISAVLAAPLGACLTHRSPVAVLRQLFALFLICAAGVLAHKTFYPELMSRSARSPTTVKENPLQEHTLGTSPRGEEAIDNQPRPDLELEAGEPPEPAEPESIDGQDVDERRDVGFYGDRGGHGLLQIVAPRVGFAC